MKLILVLAFLALVCIARSAPPASSKDRTLVLPNYDNDEEEIGLDVLDDSEEDLNTTTTTTTTTRATRRSTYVFPTRTRTTPAVRRPWLTQRTTTTVDENEFDLENIDFTGGDNGFNLFKNIREFFKKLFEDAKKFLKKVTGFDIVQFIKNFFSRKSED